jgi:hypothetical protein
VGPTQQHGNTEFGCGQFFFLSETGRFRNFLSMERGSFTQEFIAGNFGGILGITTVYPLDTLKIRQQTNPNSGSMIQVFNSMRGADGVSSRSDFEVFFILYLLFLRSNPYIVACYLLLLDLD